MPISRPLTVALFLLAPVPAFAHGPNGHPADPNLHVDPSVDDCSVQFSPELTQAAFRRFVREFGSVSAYKQMAPPNSLGQWGVSVGLEQMWFGVEDKSAAWNDTFVHPNQYHELGSSIGFPKLEARVGVTDDLDLGVFFTKSLSANYGWLGFEGKYSLLKQSRQVPITLALRSAYTKTLFIEDMDMHALTADVSAGRTFWNVFTPYLGLGGDLVLARETSDAVELDTEVAAAPHLLGGFEVRFWHVSLGAEGQLATLPSAQVQLAAVF